MAPRVVRAAKRLAFSLHADLIAASVESTRQRGLSADGLEYREGAMALSEKLGAKTVSLAGDDIVAEIIAYARRENVTTIVMGKPVRPRWKELLFGSVVDSTIRASGDIDVLVITGAEDQGTPIFRRKTATPNTWRGYGEAAVSVTLCTAAGFLLVKEFQLANVIMLYLLGVVIVSLRNGVRESLVTAIASVLAFDYCFVPPSKSFTVNDAHYLLTFFIMMAVSVILSGLTLRLKETTRSVSLRERTTSALYDLSRKLAESRKKEEMAVLAAQKASELLTYPCAVLVLANDRLSILAPSTTRFEDSPNEAAVAQWVIDHALPAGATTDTLAGSRGMYQPLTGSNGTMGALAIEVPPGSTLDTAQRHLVEAITNQLVGALERVHFAKESHLSAIQAETEQMRSNLLSAVSHDLRTPLSSIEGSAGSLLNQKELSEKSRELVHNIQDESERMARLVRNLLDMTRVQGAVDLNVDWQSLDELVANAVERTAPLFETRVSVTAPDKPLLVRVDGVLFEQVIVNLLENAARHAGPAAHVQVTLGSAGNRAIVEVVDDGPGIHPGDEEKIFDRFHRRGDSGFGLGLAICKAAIDAHGGKITAMNLSPGAKIRIELPMETPHG
jgi:two-component system sensor histidine kinase KdpD